MTKYLMRKRNLPFQIMVFKEITKGLISPKNYSHFLKHSLIIKRIKYHKKINKQVFNPCNGVYAKLSKYIKLRTIDDDLLVDEIISVFIHELAHMVWHRDNRITHSRSKSHAKAFKNLDVPGKREFLISFWIRRDRNPQTKENEFRQDYFKRVELANARFSSRKIDGWKTDEGRVLILYGIPDAVDRFPSSIDQKAYQIWYYYRVEGGVQFVFVDIRNFGEMKLVNSSDKEDVKEYNWKEWLK